MHSTPVPLSHPIWILAILAMLAPELTGCDPFDTRFAEIEPARMYEASEIEVDDEPRAHLEVLTWNIKFGGGRVDFFFDCHGDRVLMEPEEVEEHMARIAAAIRALDPDVVLLQEVDVESKRAAYLDQVRYLLEHTALNYGAYASQWKADYVPSDGIGPVDSGNVILSRYPQRQAERLALPLIESQDGLTRYFYLRRNILRSQLIVPGRDEPIYVVNTHTSAFAQDGTKKDQIDAFKAELDELAGRGEIFIAGGDLNTLPPGASQQQGFADFVCEEEDFQADDFTREATWLEPLYQDYTAAITLERYQANEASHFTHSVDPGVFWNRKLDYLFTNASFVSGTTTTHQDRGSGGVETMPLSDHAPVSGQLALP